MKQNIKRKISFKTYRISLIVLIALTALNIIGLWLTWYGLGVFGYISGTLALVCLIVCGLLAFLNKTSSVRPQSYLWWFMALIHLIFFIIAITLTNINANSNNTLPALFTVLLVSIILLGFFVMFKDKFVRALEGDKTYKLDSNEKTVEVKIENNTKPEKKTNSTKTIRIIVDETKKDGSKKQSEPKTTKTKVIEL